MFSRSLTGYRKRGPRYGVFTRNKRPRYNYGRNSGGIKERKAHTQDVLGVLPTTTTAVVLLNGIGAGIGSTQRIGDTIVVSKIMCRFCATATATSVNACYRVMLIWDKQANKALPSLDDIFVGSAPHGPLDFLELDNRKRFSTVYNSKVFAVGANTNDNDNRVYEFNTDAKAETVFINEGDTIVSLTTGALLLVTIGDKSTTPEAAKFDFQVRIRFTDGQYSGKPKFFRKNTVGNLQIG